MLAIFPGGRIPNPATILAVAILVLGPPAALFRLRWLGWWERPLARLARRRKLAILSAASLPLVLRALLLPWFPVPEPRLHDEFTFLLAADTFAHGRLVNPQHSAWVHFESEHIMVRPVYASVFPIAQAAVLALGTVLLGHPWAGVWLGVAFMCGAICWMLQGWVAPRWALMGALLAVLRFGVSSYWMNSYWGGCLAAAGGALVLGALPRIRHNPHWRHAAAMGAGLAILANSRPLEGAVFSLAIAVPLLAGMFRRPAPAPKVVLRHIILPLALVLAVTGAGMGYYFARITGKPWLMPYVLYRNTMSVAPHFVWQSPTAEPLYNNRELQAFYVGWEMHSYDVARNRLLQAMWQRMQAYWRFFLGPLLSIPLLTLPQLWRDRRTRQLLLMAAVFWLALAGQVWQAAHYAAPATGLAILIVVLGMRQLNLWRWRQIRVGRYLVFCLPPACAALLLVQIAVGAARGDQPQAPSWQWPPRLGLTRASILRSLESSPGKHLVLVRYGMSHDPGDEWVYNAADIDNSPVVWARELDFMSNEKLIRYFSDRHVWLIEPDLTRPQPVPYREAPARPMPFVQLGAPGIDALRSVEDVRNRVHDRAAAYGSSPQSCQAWNSLFTDATGVMSPDTAHGCGAGTGEGVTFDVWFSWLQRQRW